MPEIDTINLSLYCVGLNLSQFQSYCLLRINASNANNNNLFKGIMLDLLKMLYHTCFIK